MMKKTKNGGNLNEARLIRTRDCYCFQKAGKLCVLTEIAITMMTMWFA